MSHVTALFWLFAFAVTSCAACRDRPSPIAPAASTPPVVGTPAPAVTVTTVRISGNTMLAAIGATSQLTATATLSDGTTKDVTGEARWLTGDPQVVTISSTGLLTGVDFGATGISVTYQSRGHGAFATVTPPGTFVISGRAREPGQSGLPGVRVTELGSGRSTTSKAEGQFSLAGLTRTSVRLRVEKEGYEQPADFDALQGAPVDVPLQKIIRLSAGEKVTPLQLAPNDVSYTIGDQLCAPCRRVRVMVPSGGTLNVKVVTPGGGAVTLLSLLAAGQVFRATSLGLDVDVPVSVSGEHVMYLGVVGSTTALSGYIPFTIETTMR